MQFRRSKDVLFLDAEPHNADWTKIGEKIPEDGTPEFFQYCRELGMTPEHFRQLPIYRFNQHARKKAIVQSEQAPPARKRRAGRKR